MIQCFNITSKITETCLINLVENICRDNYQCQETIEYFHNSRLIT